MTQDMTKGHPLKTIIPFFLSMTIAQLANNVYGIVDTAIVGQYLGSDALGAVGSTGSIHFLFSGFVATLPCGLAIITGQRYGAHDRVGVRRSVCISLILTLISSMIVALFAFFKMRWLLTLMKTDPTIFEMTYDYISTVMLGIPATSFYFLFSAQLRALGDSTRPVYVIIASSIMNALLDLLFVCVLHWGIKGAAWATVFSQIASCICCALIIRYKVKELLPRRRSWSNPFRRYFDHLYVALPMAFQFSLMGLGATIVQSAVNHFGPDSIAGVSAAARIDSFIWIPLGALGMAATAFTAQNFGAERFDRIKQGVSYCWRFSLVFSVIFGICVIVFYKEMLMIFLDEESTSPDVFIAGQKYIYRAAPFYIMLSMIVIYRNAIQGMGHTMWPIVGGAIETVCRCFVAYYLAEKYGFIGVCYTQALVLTPNGLFMRITYMLLLRMHFRIQKMQHAAIESVGSITGSEKLAE